MERKEKKKRRRKKKYIYIIGNMADNPCLSPPDSDDSDNEGGLGNVERVVMRPPGELVKVS